MKEKVKSIMWAVRDDWVWLHSSRHRVEAENHLICEENEEECYTCDLYLLALKGGRINDLDIEKPILSSA